MELRDYLNSFQEPCPQWLKDFRSGDNFDQKKFLNSRIIYYPGSGTDGHAIKLFGSSHSAHCFVYVDHGVELEKIEAELDSTPPSNTSIAGYKSLHRQYLNVNDLTQLIPGGLENLSTVPRGFVEVLQRGSQYDDTYGAHRLAILFLSYEGVACYDAIFCQHNGVKPPFSVLIQEHGFGGTSGDFGLGGALENKAKQCVGVPQFLLVAENTMPWEGYTKFPDLNGERGGFHQHKRFLYKFTGAHGR